MCAGRLGSGGFASACVQVVETTDRAAVGELLRMAQYVDVIVPRGGKGLIERVSAGIAHSGYQALGRDLSCVY